MQNLVTQNNVIFVLRLCRLTGVSWVVLGRDSHVVANQELTMRTTVIWRFNWAGCPNNSLSAKWWWNWVFTIGVLVRGMDFPQEWHLDSKGEPMGMNVPRNQSTGSCMTQLGSYAEYVLLHSIGYKRPTQVQVKGTMQRDESWGGSLRIFWNLIS